MRAFANPDLAVRSITFAAWINPADSAYRPIMMYQRDGDYMGVVLWTGRRTGETNNGALYANFRQAAGTEAVIEIPDVVPVNTWTFVAATYDQPSGLTRIYVNGQIVKEAALPSLNPNTSGNLCIGYAPITTLDQNGGTRFNGLIDEPMVFGRALTTNEVAAIYNADSAGLCDRSPPPLSYTTDPLLLSTNGLVAAYGLNGNAADIGGNRLDGVVFGNSFTTDRFGRTNSALLVTSTNTYVDLGDRPEFEFTGGFTLNAWVKAENAPGGYVMGKYSADYTAGNLASYSYGLGTHDFRGPYGFVLGEGTVYQDIVSGPELTDGQWHLLTLTYRDGEEIRLYSDGVLRGSKATGDLPPFTNNLPLLIGRIASGIPFIGAIDDISIYQRPLGENEILALHNLQRLYGAEAPIILHNATATFSEEGYSVANAADGLVDGIASWGISPEITNQVAVFETETDVRAEQLSFKLVFNNPSVAGTTSHTLGRFRLSATTDSRDSFADGLAINGDVTANWTDLEIRSGRADSGATLTVQPDNSILVSGTLARLDTYRISASTRLKDITGFRLEVLEDPSLPHNGPGREPLNGNFALSELVVGATPANGPTITNQPSSLLATNGTAATLTIAASGLEPITYQWFLNGAALAGATNSALELTNVAFSDAGTYTVEATNPEGTTTSSGAVLNVVPAGALTLATLNVSNSSPTNAPISDIFEQPLIGTDFLARVFAGPDTNSLIAQGPAVPFLSDEDAGFFHPIFLVLTNVAQGSNAFVQIRVWESTAGPSYDEAIAAGGQHGSSPVIETPTGGGENQVPELQGLVAFSLVAAPRILEQPYDRSVLVGESASFSVQTWGSTPVFYWYLNSNVIASATSSSLLLTNLQVSDSGPVYVVVSNSVGTVASAVAALLVQVPDTTPPLVALSSPEATNTFDTSVTLSGTVSDDRGLASVIWTRNGFPGGQISLVNGQFSLTNVTLLRGTNTFRVTATDTSDNSSFAQVTITNVPSRTLLVGEIPPHQEGSRVEVPIVLRSRGDVGGVSFTLSHDRLRLVEPEIRWEPAIDGAVTSFVTNQSFGPSATVRATFALAGTVVPTGEVRIATITFRSKSVANNTVLSLRFVQQPQPTSFFNSSGNPLPPVGSETLDGSVQVTVRKYKGDNNANDRLDIGDASTIMRFESRVEPPQPWDVAKNDLNNNVQIDAGDVIRVLRAVVGLDPQPGTNGGGGGLRALAASSARMTLQFDKSTAAPGEQVKVLVSVADYSRPLAAAAFKLRYPTNALRLTGSTSHRLGNIVPASAATIWNVSPSQNNYDAQDGAVSLAVTDDRPWTTNQGLLAEFTFTVQPGATNQHRWAVALQQGELSNGIDVFAASGAESFFIGRNAMAPEFNTTPELTEEGISLAFHGETGLRYRIEASDDLQTWTVLTTVTSDGSSISYTDPIGGEAKRRFYRAVQVD